MKAAFHKTGPRTTSPANRGSIRLCGAALGRRLHVCAFFRNAEEQDRALLPFIKDGLASGHKVIYTIDPAKQDEHLDRISAFGIDVAGARRSGRLERCPWTETHLRSGEFDRVRAGFSRKIRLSPDEFVRELRERR